MSEELKLTEEEIQLILNRRKLMANRMIKQQKAEENQAVAPKKEEIPDYGVKKPAKDVILGENRPKDWDSHCNPCQVHKGRLTPGHPMYWFEENVFQKISNMEHQRQHKKIKELLGMPVQTNSRDRVYHALSHLDALWTQELLPVAYKIRYEEYKKEHGIGDDNIHPAHKKPGVVYKTPKFKRPWNPEDHKDYDPDEKFVGDRG